MPWFKVDDGFHGHPKVVELSLGAVGIWTLAGSWCAKYLTDGLVSNKAITRMGGDDTHAAELVGAGLWLSADDGFEFKDWADYQPLKIDVELERSAAQERMRSVRARKKGVRANIDRTDPERSGELRENFGRSSEDVRVTPSHPSPIPSQSPKVQAAKRGTRIPEPFILTGEMRSWAADRAPHVDVNLATERFANHWRAKTRDATKLDWLATWHNWILSDFQKAGTTKQTKDERALSVIEQGRRIQESRDREAIES